MIDKYEAAELFVIGRAKDVILGAKIVDDDDNTTGNPPELREEFLASFDE